MMTMMMMMMTVNLFIILRSCKEKAICYEITDVITYNIVIEARIKCVYKKLHVKLTGEFKECVKANATIDPCAI